MNVSLPERSWIVRVILYAVIVLLLLASRVELSTFTYQGF